MTTRKNLGYHKSSSKTAIQAKKEIDAGLKLLQSVKLPIISFFGSSQTSGTEKWSEHAEKTAYLLGKAGCGIMTGGGPGVMRAANKGGFDSGTESIGVWGNLIKNEKVDKKYFTKHVAMRYVFVRRFILSIKSDAMLFYPGGYGTLNELFEFLVLMQINITDEVPMILVNKKFWKGLFTWVKKEMHPQYLKHKHDLDLVQFADTPEEVLKILKKSKTI